MCSGHNQITATFQTAFVTSLIILVAGCGAHTQRQNSTKASAPAAPASAPAPQAAKQYGGPTTKRWQPVPVPGGVTTRVPEAGLEFELPNSEWNLVDHKQPSETVVLYGFKRAAVMNQSGEPILPYIAVIVEHAGPNNGNWAEFYALKVPKLPPTKIERMLDFREGEVGALNAGGYRGIHNLGDRPHTVFVVFALHGEVAFNVIMDATSDVIEQVEPEFQAMLKSLRHYQTETPPNTALQQTNAQSPSRAGVAER